MRLLILGGSYFYGRVFVMEAAKEHDVTVLNRGTYSMEEFGAKQITGDRHDTAVLAGCKGDFDAVIDFCAYGSGDVRQVIENLPGQIGQYILISTVDVYARGLGVMMDEDTAFECRELPGEAGSYIAGKVALEKEIRRVCGEREIPYTIIRPAILYGPYNYAPRESVYIQMLLQNHALPAFTDADGRFQFVYVKDAATAVLKCLGNERTFGQAYNLCQDEILTYKRFFEVLKKVAQKDKQIREMNGADAAKTKQAMAESGETPVAVIPLTIKEAMEQGVPVPFPATAAETHLCDNTKSKTELGVEYTDFEEGMARTFRAFRHVFE